MPDNAVDEGADAFVEKIDLLHEAVNVNRGLVLRTERNRIGLLIVHGIYKILIAVAILRTNSGALNAPALRYLPLRAISYVALVGGLLVLVGVFSSRWRPQLVGLLCIFIFDVVFALGLVAAYAAGPEGLLSTKTLSYPIFVYMHLATIMGIHSYSIMTWRMSLHRRVRNTQNV